MKILVHENLKRRPSIKSVLGNLRKFRIFYLTEVSTGGTDIIKFHNRVWFG